MFLDLGQKNFGSITCSICNMMYTPGKFEDDSLHAKFHKDFTQAIVFNGWKQERVVKTFGTARVIKITKNDPSTHRKKSG